MWFKSFYLNNHVMIGDWSTSSIFGINPKTLINNKFLDLWNDYGLYCNDYSFLRNIYNSPNIYTIYYYNPYDYT